MENRGGQRVAPPPRLSNQVSRYRHVLRHLASSARSPGLQKQVKLQSSSGGKYRSATTAIKSGSAPPATQAARIRSEEHTSELQSLMRTSYAVFCLKKNNTKKLNAQ